MRRITFEATAARSSWSMAISNVRIRPRRYGASSRLAASGAAFELVFRHFPLRDIHPHAEAAAAISEAAARQGRFWEMHDLLFSNQRHLEDADLRRLAERLGLDMTRVESDLVDPAIAARVDRDVESGARSGVDGTPSLFIDGMRYRGPRDPASLGAALTRGVHERSPSRPPTD